MREPDADWNRRERQESELQRLDRNFNELLQELRVAQTGVQILFAFLLTLAFTQRFGEVTGFQGGLYYGTLVAAALATSLLIAPVSLHRLLFRRHQKGRVVIAANRLAVGGLVALWLALVGVLWFITDVLYGHVPGAAAAVVSALWFGALWFALAVSLPHERRSVPIARHVVRAAMANLGVTPTCVHDIEVALSEACTNVLEHAGAPDEYEVRLQVDDDRCVLRVVDVGERPGRLVLEMPAEPPDGEVERGRGLVLMRALVDRVGFAPLEERGTVVSLEKRLDYTDPGV